MKFKALIDGVHFDPKKGAVKIVLVGASHVSLDELTTLSPNDETIQVTLESPQAKLTDIGDSISLGENAARKLKEAAGRLRDPKEEAEVVMSDEETEENPHGVPPIQGGPYGR